MRLTWVALAVALLGAGGVAAWGLQLERAGDTATYAVEALGPEGPVLAGNVTVRDATALSALEALARAEGVPLTLEAYPGMGTYVRAIGPHRAAGADGWVYEVQRAGAWTSGDRSAELYPLQKGDALRWSWTAR